MKVSSLFLTAILISTFYACNNFISSPSNKGRHDLLKSSAARTSVDMTAEKFITSNPAAFAKRLKGLNNENEVLIVLKAVSASRISKSIIKELPNQAIVALPKSEANISYRTTPSFAPVNDQSRQTVKTILTSHNIKNIVAPDFGNVIDVKIPADKVIPVLTALLNSSNVDYIEASQSHLVHFDSRPLATFKSFVSVRHLNQPLMLSNPEGSNLADYKHTYHDVLQAWNYTRGSGAKIGILDSGFAFDQNTNSYHQDGKLLAYNKGVKKLGFIDDFDDFGNCNNANGQPYGACLGWDGHGHGTYMVGLSGQNDNNIGRVGIAPEALTVSMKVAQNCFITDGCKGGNVGYRIEDDDLHWAISWARNNDVDVLSMSYSSTGISFTTLIDFYQAYHQDDILLLSSTGNPGDDAGFDYPQKLNTVMGIGGVNLDGSNYGKDQFEDVSALALGAATRAFCPSSTAFCEPNGSSFIGGTSTSTAVTAGIAGLVRAYEPSLSAAQAWDRLVNTSVGIHHTVNAVRAVLNDIPLTATINGPVIIQVTGNYSWAASVEGANTGITYLWEYKSISDNTWQTVSTVQTYSRIVTAGGENFILRLTATSGTEQDITSHIVNVAIENCPPGDPCQWE